MITWETIQIVIWVQAIIIVALAIIMYRNHYKHSPNTGSGNEVKK